MKTFREAYQHYIVLNGLFGHWQTWLLLGSAWVALGLVSALALGVIARVGKGKEYGK